MKLLPAFTGTPEVNTVYNVDALTLLRAFKDCSAALHDSPQAISATVHAAAGRLDRLKPREPCAGWRGDGMLEFHEGTL